MHMVAGSPGHCIPSMDYEQKERLRASQGPLGQDGGVLSLRLPSPALRQKSRRARAERIVWTITSTMTGTTWVVSMRKAWLRSAQCRRRCGHLQATPSSTRTSSCHCCRSCSSALQAPSWWRATGSASKCGCGACGMTARTNRSRKGTRCESWPACLRLIRMRSRVSTASGSCSHREVRRQTRPSISHVRTTRSRPPSPRKASRPAARPTPPASHRVRRRGRQRRARARSAPGTRRHGSTRTRRSGHCPSGAALRSRTSVSSVW